MEPNWPTSICSICSNTGRLVVTVNDQSCNVFNMMSENKRSMHACSAEKFLASGHFKYAHVQFAVGILEIVTSNKWTDICL